ncbi:hypothetical protein CcCBS67573_g00431 [Chytriomyces confervae]|uniref:AB hydrolase-1 domain-containing protein n=1 Tax=Chytriomyces confervae TaxID=246404 RepID=A0A507FSB6_9FUNG|nr:hypothetical protein CcCBS67573_g00431 [Chytriomyces confervae]
MLLSHIVTPAASQVSIPATIILHGFLGSKKNWRPVARLLTPRLGPIVLADLRNHGESPHSDTHNHKAMAQDVFHLADHLGFKTFNLVGHSQGGKTAMHMALERGNRINKLVVVDTTPASYDLSLFHGYIDRMKEISAARISSLDAAESILAKTIPDGLIRRFLMTNLKMQPDGRLDFIVNLQALEGAVKSLDAHTSTWGFPFHEPGVKFEGPTLVVRGTKSNYVRGKKEALLLSRFPNAEIVDLETGHWVHHEKPKEFANCVGDFLLDSTK